MEWLIANLGGEILHGLVNRLDAFTKGACSLIVVAVMVLVCASSTLSTNAALLPLAPMALVIMLIGAGFWMARRWAAGLPDPDEAPLVSIW